MNVFAFLFITPLHNRHEFASCWIRRITVDYDDMVDVIG